MSILESSALLVIGELVQGALKSVGAAAGEAVSSQVVGLLRRQCRDHSQRLADAITRASDRAWRALEIALEGDSLWQRLRQKVSAPADDQAFAAQVKTYLARAALGELHVDRGRCLADLRAARKAGALRRGEPRPEDAVSQPDFFARFSDPAAQLSQEQAAGQAVAAALRPDYPHLAALLAIQARQGQSLFAVALRYFFRRAVEEDAALARGLALAQAEQIQAAHQEGFDALARALAAAGDRLEGLLGEVSAAVHETHRYALDIHAEQQQQGQQLRRLYDEVVRLQAKFDLPPAEVRPRDSLSIRGDEERALVKQLVAQFRQLPAEQRRQLPALLNGLGKLELAAGDFQGASAEFAAVAGLVHDPAARAEAHHNAYRAALERRDWAGALGHLQQAVAAEPARFAPFPLDKFEPARILGAGGFGVAFLCQHRFLRSPVVVKTSPATTWRAASMRCSARRRSSAS